MSVNTSFWVQQHNKSVYSTKTQPVTGQKVKRQNSKNGLKQKDDNNNNMRQNQSQHVGISKHNISKQSNTSQPQTKLISQQSLQMQKLDNQFVTTLHQLQQYYIKLTKHEQIRVQKWIVKIIQNDQTLRWKQNRNNYLKLLMHIVKNNSSLLEPFDKIPDFNKDLTYMSDHEFSQRTKPRFDGKSPVFHLHKPQIIKINQPQGDNCSVLMSIVNTARTVKDKENIIHEDQNKIIQKPIMNDLQIKQSQLIELQISSAIPSNLPSNNPSQVKSITPYSHSSDNNKFLFSKKQKIIQDNQQTVTVQKFKMQKYNNHQKYSVRNSVVQSSHQLLNKNSLTSSYLHRKNIVNHPKQQLKVYKQMVLTMGRLLLKHQFAIQNQSQYWRLMRMIYSYQSSIRNSFNNSPKINKHDSKYSVDLKNGYEENGESFEDFLSRLREQIGQSVKKNNQICTPDNDISSNRFSINNHNQPSSNSQSHTTKLSTANKNFIYNDNQTINHITQQSLDFKVEQGIQSQHMLYYELGGEKRKQSLNSNNNYGEKLCGSQQQDKHSHLIIDQHVSHVIECNSPQLNSNKTNEDKLFSSQHMNNSLMQISDSYREIRTKHNTSNQQNHNNNSRNYNIQEDYHNVYDQPQEEQQDEISFTDKPLIDDDQEYEEQQYQQQEGNIQQDEYHQYEHQQQQQQIDDQYQYDDSNNHLQSSPQFTDDGQQQNSYYQQQQSQLMYHRHDSQQQSHHIQNQNHLNLHN